MTTTSAPPADPIASAAPELALPEAAAGISLLDALALTREVAAAALPGFDFYLVGYPRAGGRPIRLACPRHAAEGPAVAKVRRPPDEGSNAALVLQALAEAKGPLTMAELADKAVGGRPSGALKAAVRQLVEDGQVVQANDYPARFTLPGGPDRNGTLAAGSNGDVILSALAEAGRPLTVVGLAERAIGRAPTSAFRQALKKLVDDGRVRETIDGQERRYALAPAGDFAEGGNCDVILTVLGEADRPLTVVELAHKAVGSEPSGAFRKALRRLVDHGRVREAIDDGVRKYSLIATGERTPATPADPPARPVPTNGTPARSSANGSTFTPPRSGSHDDD